MEILSAPATRAQGISDGLSSLVAPLGKDRFLSEYVGKRPVLIRGSDHGRFTSLAGWDVVSELLSSVRVETDRMRVKSGLSLVAPELFTEPAPQIAQRGQPLRFVPDKLAEILATDGTLVVDCFHELHAPLRKLAGAVEQAVKAVTQVNLYLNTVNSSAGSDLHWDDHEVIIAQVEGAKRWALYAPTVEAPVTGWTRPVPPDPEASAWSGVLAAGDVLYVPRGWWHEVRASEGPSVHLSFSARLPWGGQLLQQLTRHLAMHTPEIRHDLPVFATAADERAWFERLRGAVVTAVAQPGVLETLASRLAKEPQPRPSFDFAASGPGR
ncbi:JmjC domain-containing protein [Streptomyces adustus]|uniref:JmjC domain-containing protein n=1 Tax=Streptomyces adustus TaxID=1609272 RepID=UPI0035DB5DD9